MVWGILFLVLALAAAAARLGDLAVACGLVAVGLGWRPVACGLHVGAIAHRLTRRQTEAAAGSVRRGGAGGFKPIDKAVVERIAAASTGGIATGGRENLPVRRDDATGRNPATAPHG